MRDRGACGDRPTLPVGRGSSHGVVETTCKAAPSRGNAIDNSCVLNPRSVEARRGPVNGTKKATQCRGDDDASSAQNGDGSISRSVGPGRSPPAGLALWRQDELPTKHELSVELSKLRGKFDEWHRHVIDAFELEQAIHGFITVPRELFNRYSSGAMLIRQSRVR